MHEQKVFGEFHALPEVKETCVYFVIIYINYTHTPSSRPLLP